MIHTFFYNASGLPDDRQITTARDMTILARALIHDFPEYYRYFGEQYYIYKGRTLYNTDHLLSQYPGMDGMKDGYTRAAGFNLVASAVRDGHRVIAVLLGGQTAAARNTMMTELLDEGFGRDTAVAAAQPTAGAGMRPIATAAPAPALRLNAAPSHGITLTDTAVAAEPTARDVASLQPEGGSWGIQVGAFADINSGRRAVNRAAEAAPAILGQARPDLVAVSNGRGAVYRARLVGLDRSAAHAACAELSRTGQACLVVPPPRL